MTKTKKSILVASLFALTAISLTACGTKAKEGTPAHESTETAVTQTQEGNSSSVDTTATVGNSSASLETTNPNNGSIDLGNTGAGSEPAPAPTSK